MSATILAFTARGDALCLAPCLDIHTRDTARLAVSCMDIHTTGAATALATKFTDHFLPIVQASVDLLEADESDFEARCRRMLDSDGTVMIDELCAEMEIVGEQMQLLVDELELTRELRTAMAKLAPLTAS